MCPSRYVGASCLSGLRLLALKGTVTAQNTAFPKFSWCAKVFSRGFRRPNCDFSKDFLTRETFFQKYGANFKGHQGLRLAGAPGGWVAFVLFRPAWVGFRPCPPVPPASCPVHLQKIGLLWGLNWDLCVRPFVRPCGAFIILPACVPCQDRDKGRKFSYLLPVVSCPQKKTVTGWTFAII